MMLSRLGRRALGAAALLGSLALAPTDARACGGCFHAESEPETTLVTGHRMALAISPVQTVLWDQIEYAGSPGDFAWVLPVKPGAYIEASNGAWFDALDAATATRIVAPSIQCANNGGDFEGGGFESSGGCGCADMGSLAMSDGFRNGGSSGAGGDGGPPPVTVVHRGTVGPYETVTVKANEPGALTGWLQNNGYAIDATAEPIIEAYTAEGFDFIALRLAPDQGIQQMQPVRVVSPGAVPALPLRMVAAGTGPNVALTLFVLGEGRWMTQNFPTNNLDPERLSWDFAASASNLAELREETLAQDGGRTWLASYAKRKALLSPLPNPALGGNATYFAESGRQASTIAELYIEQGTATEGGVAAGCMGAFSEHASSNALVVDTCTGQEEPGEPCPKAGIGTIAAQDFACDWFDDVAVALTGMHPADVWVTRLDSVLPRAALALDLALSAAPLQAEVDNWHTAAIAVNPPCELAAPGAAAASGPSDRARRTDRMIGGGGLLALAAVGLRRLRRRLRVARVAPARLASQ